MDAAGLITKIIICQRDWSISRLTSVTRVMGVSCIRPGLEMSGDNSPFNYCHPSSEWGVPPDSMCCCWLGLCDTVPTYFPPGKFTSSDFCFKAAECGGLARRSATGVCGGRTKTLDSAIESLEQELHADWFWERSAKRVLSKVQIRRCLPK